MNCAAQLDLNPLLNPRFIAVIGASAQGGRATGAVRNLQELGFTGAIYPVNPKYESVLGLKCYPSLEAIPGPVVNGVYETMGIRPQQTAGAPLAALAASMSAEERGTAELERVRAEQGFKASVRFRDAPFET